LIVLLTTVYSRKHDYLSDEDRVLQKQCLIRYIFFLVVAIKNGKEITRFTGAADENKIQKMVDQLSR
jgi:thioredoxin-like negative regulator of GroEL